MSGVTLRHYESENDYQLIRELLIVGLVANPPYLTPCPPGGTRWAQATRYCLVVVVSPGKPQIFF